MKKNIEDITFDNIDFTKYQKEIDNINYMCKQLENDKSFQKTYKRFLKHEEKKILKVHYNNIKNVCDNDILIPVKAGIKFKIKSESQNINFQVNRGNNKLGDLYG